MLERPGFLSWTLMAYAKYSDLAIPKASGELLTVLASLLCPYEQVLAFYSLVVGEQSCVPTQNHHCDSYHIYGSLNHALYLGSLDPYMGKLCEVFIYLVLSDFGSIVCDAWWHFWRPHLIPASVADPHRKRSMALVGLGSGWFRLWLV